MLTSAESIASLVDGVAQLRACGKKVLLVTSGAVGQGMKALGLARRPRKLDRIQALAAIGQGRLMAAYTAEAARHHFAVAQLLLTAADLRDRERHLNVMNCINSLWEDDVLPVVNENDSVSVDELKFGDNDILAGMLASVTGSDLVVILTTESGLRSRNADGTLGERIPIVTRITDDILELAGGTDNGEFSIGGMKSKLRSAMLANASGAALCVADGRNGETLAKVIAGEDVGTLFVPEKKHLHGRKRFIRFFSRISGSLTVDSGAATAVRLRGKSLLPSGLTRVEGSFRRGDAVELLDSEGNAFARGLVNFTGDECRQLIGKQSSSIAQIIGSDTDEVLVHRDNLCLL